MGIKDFTKVFKYTREVSLKDIKGDLAVDAFYELFKNQSMQHSAKLTNKEGESTLYISIVLANLVKRKSIKADDIWCWDSRDPKSANDTKAKTWDQRHQIRDQNFAKISQLETEISKLKSLENEPNIRKIDPTYDDTLRKKIEEREKLAARNPTAQHFNKMVEDCIFILTKLGVRMAIAAPGYDAESVAAQLCKDDIVDGVLSADTDVLAYGGTRLVKKIAGVTGKYHEYVLEDCLKEHNLTQKELIQVATVLGCDFCDKTPGIGPGTVIKKFRSIEYTDEQKAAQQRFTTKPVYKYIEPKSSKESISELTEWLVVKQGFKRDRIDKMLSVFF